MSSVATPRSTRHSPRTTPPTHPAPRLLPAVGAAVSGAVAVLVLGLLVTHYTGDFGVVASFNHLNTGAIGAVSGAVYAGLEPAWAVLLTVALAAVIAYRHRNLLVGLRFGAAVALMWLPVVAFKLIVHRPRPLAAALAHPTPIPSGDWSYPSGHAAFVVALALAGVFVAGSVTARRLVAVLGALFVAGVVVVLLVTGVHYPTDILASAIWATSVSALAWQLSGIAADRAEHLLAARRTATPAA